MVYNEFEKRRPQSMLTADAPFFLGYKRHWKPSDDVWYTDRPLGKNKIGEFLSKCPAVQDQKLISSGKKVSNHSVRKTEITRLIDADTPQIFVSQLAGHKRLESLNSYYAASMKQQRRMSDILSAGDENKPPQSFHDIHPYQQKDKY